MRDVAVTRAPAKPKITALTNTFGDGVDDAISVSHFFIFICRGSPKSLKDGYIRTPIFLWQSYSRKRELAKIFRYSLERENVKS